ncbi:MAG: tetratricopeptide repeat protein [Candidatus Polarisedimenticolia bacterium]
MRGRRLLLAAVAALLATTAARAEASAGEAADPWKDPQFQQRFLGSYGALSDKEPRLSAEERTALEKIIPLMSNNLPEAASQLAALIDPNSSALLDYTLGNVYFQLDRVDDAIASYTAAVHKFPDFQRAWRNLALSSVRGGKLAESIPAFTRLIELGGGDAFTYGLLGHAYASKEDYMAAESAYRQAALLSPATLDWKLGMARCLFKQQKYGEAAALTGKLIEEHPDRVDFWVLQANAYLGLKEPMEAARNYEILARMGKATPELMQQLGDIYVNESLMQPAARAYVNAIELAGAPDSAALGRALRGAEVLAARGARDETREVMAAVRKAGGDQLDEDLRRRMLKLEARFAVQDGGGLEAAPVLEEIVTLDPLDGEALMLLGELYSRAGEQEKAMFYYERAESIEKYEADAKLRRAQLLVKQSRFMDALPLLKRSQELKPREDVARYLEQVERVARTKP